MAMRACRVCFEVIQASLIGLTSTANSSALQVAVAGRVQRLKRRGVGSDGFQNYVGTLRLRDARRFGTEGRRSLSEQNLGFDQRPESPRLFNGFCAHARRLACGADAISVG